MKLRWLIAALAALLLVSYGIAKADFVLEWPHHKDFLMLVEERKELTESLYNTETACYWWPKTLAQFGIDFDDYKK